MKSYYTGSRSLNPETRNRITGQLLSHTSSAVRRVYWGNKHKYAANQLTVIKNTFISYSGVNSTTTCVTSKGACDIDVVSTLYFHAPIGWFRADN